MTLKNPKHLNLEWKEYTISRLEVLIGSHHPRWYALDTDMACCYMTIFMNKSKVYAVETTVVLKRDYCHPVLI